MALKEKAKTNNKVDKNEAQKQIVYSDGTYTIHVPIEVMKETKERINKMNDESANKSK